ncbi:hypothetical protein [Burkholderia stabilis]|uniref:hypothetical protein n=1 Tax=Burkholderia stabilis TaxID=95485 RepID=UPI00158D0D74|nr:hypothetical protein [Burkholderia stabilis]
MVPDDVFEGAAIRPPPNAVIVSTLCASHGKKAPTINKNPGKYLALIPVRDFALMLRRDNVRQAIVLASDDIFSDLTNKVFFIPSTACLRR